eukprot:9099226-Pyramimonas_sp.AAC.1
MLHEIVASGTRIQCNVQGIVASGARAQCNSRGNVVSAARILRIMTYPSASHKNRSTRFGGPNKNGQSVPALARTVTINCNKQKQYCITGIGQWRREQQT